MTKVRVLALLAVMVMMMGLMMPAVASAQAPPEGLPHVFTGTVTVNGLTAPAGTSISAVIGGVEQAPTAVGSDGSYLLKVSSGTSGSTKITFKIDALTALEAASWTRGKIEFLDLTAGGGVVGPGGKGAKGDQGATGSPGAKGDSGDKGETGVQGVAGVDGKDGKDGEAGVAGEAGAPGKDGSAGADGAAGGGGAVGMIGLILSIVALLGVAGVFFASRKGA